MRRRDFLGVLGGAAAVPAMLWPLAARSQQAERVRRIGVLTGGTLTDNPEGQARKTAFLQALAQLGWTDGRNVDRKSTRLNSSHIQKSRMPSSA